MGWDLGSSASKASLVYVNRHNEVCVARVPFAGGSDDPERSDTPHDFIACAAFKDDEVIVGKMSLDEDITIPLKTMLVFLAGIRRKTVETLPGGRLLLEAMEGRRITKEAMRKAIIHHFGVLRTSILEEAEGRNVTIKVIVVTHPNYLASHSQSGDHDLYLEHYLSLLSPLWGDGIHFETASEGQAAANYICERFDGYFYKG